MSEKNSIYRSLTILILLICITTPQIPVYGDLGVDWWPLFGHDPEHARTSPSTGPNNDTLLWSITTGLQARTTIVDNGILYIGSYNGTLLAVNAAIGASLWRRNLGSNWLSLAASSGKIFVGSMDGNLYALNSVTGEDIWTFKASGGIFSSPTAVEGVVFLASEDPYCYALDADTGAIIWKTLAGGSKRSSPTIADGVAYFRDAGESAHLFAFDAKTGEQLWSVPAPSATYADSAPAIVNGVLFYGSIDSKIYALDAKTGAPRWSYTTGGKIGSSPAVHNGVLYVGSDQSDFYAVDIQTGVKLWEYPSEYSVYASPLVADGKIFIGKWDALGYPNAATVLALRADDGSLVWSHQAGRVFASPAIANGVLYVATYDTNQVYAYGALDGRTWATAFDFTDVDEMIQDGWTISKPGQTTLTIGGGVILDGGSDGSEITYSSDIPEDIYDWKIDAKATWLGGGHAGAYIKMVTESHSYVWAVDGGNGQYEFLRDNVAAVAAPGYTEALGEAINLTMMRVGNIITLFGDGKYITSFLEPDSTPSRVTAVTVGSPANTRHEYQYISAFVPKPDEAIPPQPIHQTLTVNSVGSGAVIISPEKTQYELGEEVQLTAVPAQGYKFTGWTGDHTGDSNPTTVTMETSKSITAIFEKESTGTIISGLSNGTVVSSNRVTITFESQDPRAQTFEVKVDGGEWMSTGLQKNYTSSGLSLGDHTIQVRALDSESLQIDATTVHIVTTVWIPPATNTVASTVATVAIFSLVSVAASAATSTAGSSLSWLGDRLKELLPEGVKSWLEGYLSSRRPTSLEAKTGPIYVLTGAEYLAYALALIALTLAFSYAGSGTINDMLTLLPTVLATGVVVAVVKNLANEMIARALGVWSEHRVWFLGLATFTVSTLLFKIPFSSPSRIVSHSPQSTVRKVGLISSSSVVISLILAGVFYLLYYSGYTVIGSLGLAMCLLAALFDVIPIAPMNGRDIYDWNKVSWIALASISVTLFLLWLLLL